MSLAIPLMYFDGRPFTRADATASGWTDARLRKHLDSGLIRRLVKGVYVDALAPDTLELRAEAVCLVTPPDAVVCRRTAAWLYGIDALALREQDEIPTVESVRPPKRRSTRVDITAGHSQTLRGRDIQMYRGLRVTTPLATAVHLARHLRRPYALSAIDAMLHAGLITLEELRTAVCGFRYHPGIRQARELALYAEPLTESHAESWLRLRVIDAGFPRPVPQVEVRGLGRTYRIDLGFPHPRPDGLRVGLEYDSDRWHSGKAAELRDDTRRAELRKLGWLVLPVRRGDVWGQRPGLENAIGELLSIQPRLPRRW